MAGNNSKAVTTGKPKKAGPIWRAPIGTALPTDAETALDKAFVCVGYVSEDGVEMELSTETEKHKAWGGETVNSSQTEKSETIKFSMLQVLDSDVLKAVYGDSNVSGSLTEGMTVRSNAEELEACILVIDMIHTGGVKHRIVAPNAKVSETGSITYKDDELVKYEQTYNCLAGGFKDDSDMVKEYYKN